MGWVKSDQLRNAQPMEPPADGNRGCQANDELGWGLTTTATAYRKWAIDAVAALPSGLRGYLILSAVSRACSPSQLALANQLGIDKSSMTALVDGLESAGLIERRPDPDDRRARQLLITEAGLRVLAQARARLDLAEQRLLAPLTPSEASLFRDMVARIAQPAPEDASCPGDDTAGPLGCE
jgi:DNA-binding MarR family transcriptional regulator